MPAARPPFLLFVLAGFSATGCTLIPDYRRPESGLPATFPASPEVVPPAQANVAPDGFFNDANLRELIEISIAGSPDLRAAVLRVEQSRAQYGVTAAARFPEIRADAGLTRSHARGETSDAFSANLGAFAYEVDLFGRVRSLTRQALEKYLATEEGARSARLALIDEVAGRFLDLRQAQEQEQLAGDALNAARDHEALTRAAFQAGAGDELDVSAAKARLESVKISALVHRRREDQARNALALLAGGELPVRLLDRPTAPTPEPVREIPPGLPSDLILRRPDIIRAEHSLISANAAIGAARAAYFPSVKLTGSVGSTTSQFEKLFGKGTGVWSF